MNNQDIRDAFESGERIDRAMDRAFLEAVRLHRLHEVPMALWEDGKVRQVDPFTIPLPEDEDAHAARHGASHGPESGTNNEH
jgi:hypothetical protein